MNFFKKFRSPQEWKNFEAANSKVNSSIISYSNSVKSAFNDNFAKMSNSLYPSRVDPFIHLQNQMILLSVGLRDKIKTSLLSSGCINHLKQINGQFSVYKAEYELALQQEKMASQEFQQTSKAISKVQNQNDFRKAELESQSAFSKEKECTKEANKAQLEFVSKSNEYQKNFCTILLSNLEVDLKAQKNIAQQYSSIGPNLFTLSQVQIRFPEIKKVKVDYENLRKKILKNKSENELIDQIDKQVKNVD